MSGYHLSMTLGDGFSSPDIFQICKEMFFLPLHLSKMPCFLVGILWPFLPTIMFLLYLGGPGGLLMVPKHVLWMECPERLYL